MNEMRRNTAEGEFIQIKKIGNSLGLILSKDILSRLRLKEGDKLFVVEQTDRGVKLSPGQRQRIAIARAFLKDAPILLLDEATSALDTESEEAVRQALDRLMRHRTVIAIAHRLATLRNFDRIVVLQAGRITEDGTPEALMKHRGTYRDLVRREMSRLGAQAA